MYLANVLCALVGLLVTVALEIPRHAKLEEGGKQRTVIRELVFYNWPRTLSITGCALLTVLMLPWAPRQRERTSPYFRESENSCSTHLGA
jgi:hypothetical protein